jgi:hypothetical protein
MQLSKKDLFFCYDLGLKNIMRKNNIEYITTALTNNNKRFWLYFRTNEVNELIKQYMGQ